MAAQFKRPSPRRLIQVAFLSWMSMLGVDFLLHAGLLSNYYTRPSPFLLPPKEAVRLIPVGYLAFLLLTVLLMWLMVRLEVEGWRAGFVFGLKLGVLTWGAMVLGLVSISTAEVDLLAGWWLGQSIELGIAGAVTGIGLKREKLRSLALWVIGLVAALILATIGLQSLGLATAVGI